MSEGQRDGRVSGRVAGQWLVDEGDAGVPAVEATALSRCSGTVQGAQPHDLCAAAACTWGGPPDALGHRK